VRLLCKYSGPVLLHIEEEGAIETQSFHSFFQESAADRQDFFSSSSSSSSSSASPSSSLPPLVTRAALIRHYELWQLLAPFNDSRHPLLFPFITGKAVGLSLLHQKLLAATHVSPSDFFNFFITPLSEHWIAMTMRETIIEASRESVADSMGLKDELLGEFCAEVHKLTHGVKRLVYYAIQNSWMLATQGRTSKDLIVNSELKTQPRTVNFAAKDKTWKREFERGGRIAAAVLDAQGCRFPSEIASRPLFERLHWGVFMGLEFPVDMKVRVSSGAQVPLLALGSFVAMASPPVDVMFRCCFSLRACGA
jgi:hypothetical protein